MQTIGETLNGARQRLGGHAVNPRPAMRMLGGCRLSSLRNRPRLGAGECAMVGAALQAEGG